MNSLVTFSIVVTMIIYAISTQPYQFVNCPNDNNTYPQGTTCDYDNYEEPFLQEKFDAKEERENNNGDDKDKDDS